jgi:hypothetical protein
MMSIQERLARLQRQSEPKREIPGIPCLGRWWETDAGREFDCDYEKAEFGCEDCIVNGGRMNPVTGKRYRRPRKKE